MKEKPRSREYWALWGGLLILVGLVIILERSGYIQAGTIARISRAWPLLALCAAGAIFGRLKGRPYLCIISPLLLMILTAVLVLVPVEDDKVGDGLLEKSIGVSGPVIIRMNLHADELVLGRGRERTLMVEYQGMPRPRASAAGHEVELETVEPSGGCDALSRGPGDLHVTLPPTTSEISLVSVSDHFSGDLRELTLRKVGLTLTADSTYLRLGSLSPFLEVTLGGHPGAVVIEIPREVVLEISGDAEVQPRSGERSVIRLNLSTRDVEIRRVPSEAVSGNQEVEI